MSPTIFRAKGYRFYFLSNEEDRIHVHVANDDGEAKFWLEPIVSLAVYYKGSTGIPVGIWLNSYRQSGESRKSIQRLCFCHHS